MRYAITETRQDGLHAIRLQDTKTDLTAEILPDAGLITSALILKGCNFLWRPDMPLSDIVDRKLLFGIPFLAPWANRLNANSYWVNGARYEINRGLRNIRPDHYDQPIHGLLLFEKWRVEELNATDRSAELVSSFAFSRYPQFMAQFPFAHRLEMRHKLAEGRLHVTVKIVNECNEALPVSLGYHPYYALPYGQRDDWQLTLSAQDHYELSAKHIPTGKHSPVTETHLDVKSVDLDDVYGRLRRGEDGFARFSVESEKAQLTAGFGPKYEIAVVYAPKTGNYVCLEPMAALTDALNLFHEGLAPALQSVEPGGSWEEEFWIEPSLKA
jgi:aldose 1-epimerase